ncbi:MAG: hypothetical protein ACUVUP_04550 [Thermaceae bacterium]
MESSRDPVTGALDKNKTNCDAYLTPKPALVSTCAITYSNNDTDFKITAEYVGGTRGKVVYENGTIKFQ